MLRSSTLRYGLFLMRRGKTSAPILAVPSAENTGIEGLNVKNVEDDANKLTKSQLVSNAFSTLKRSTELGLKTSLDEKIDRGKTPESLLSLSQHPSLTRKQALRIVTTLAEWAVSGQAEMSSFEADQRFIALCQLLGKPNPVAGNVISKHGDLSVVLGVTGDDEAAKLISTITLPQMIRVLISLAQKKKRSIPLLRSLAFNIGRIPSKLDIKQGADIMYSLATLSFPDEALLEKVTFDITECLDKCMKSSVVGSICTSCGILKYKDTELLDRLAEWMVKHNDLCRNQEIVSILITLATVNHKPSNSEEFFKLLVPRLVQEDVPSASAWLDVVWSLAVLGQAEEKQLQSVLNSSFVDKISVANSGRINNINISIPFMLESNFSWRKKLLNVNGVAKWTKGYEGPLLKDTNINFPIIKSKEKVILTNSVLDVLSNLFPSSTYLRTNIDSGMGFFIDAECMVDAKLSPVPIIDKKTGQPVPTSGKGTKIAVMIWDYHDNTRGRISLNGAASLSINMLNNLGYGVLSISHSEYNIKDKLSNRVKNLESELKKLANTRS